jgi:hypothetical protein
MKDRIVFFNIGWMDFYKGISNDKISGGGKYVEIQGWGHEMYNFKEFNSRLFGYVQPKINKRYNTPCIVKLEKIGGSNSDNMLDKVTLVRLYT